MVAGLSRLRVVAPPLKTATTLASRRYGSAALAYDYYYSDDEDYETAPRAIGDRPRLASAGSEPSRGVQWVMIGEPGARKHVYAERLAKLLEVPHISVGSLVKQELDPRSSLYKQIAKLVNEGKLVPEEIIFALLSKRLEEGYYRGESSFILDGIPRTRMQAEVLDQIADINLVVNFKCTKEQSSRNNVTTGILSPQKFLSMDEFGHRIGLSEARKAWEEKLCIYAEQSKPLEDYYRRQKKLLDFQVAGAPGETWQGLLAALHLQHMNAVSPSQKLTA